MSKLPLFCLVALSLLAAAGCQTPHHDEAEPSASLAPLAGSRPNIIFVLTDDQSMGDLSCMGNELLRTPHLDRLHRLSTRFTDFQVSSTCAPTRSALMSGRHPFEVGVTHTVLQRERMALDVVTLPETLKKAGYTTGLFGKWHLGDERAYRPQSRGFDEVLMHGSGGIGQTQWGDFPVNEANRYFDNVLLHNETVVQTKGFCTDLFMEAALAWIRRQHKAKQPYFAYIPLNAPHGPMIAPEPYKQRFLEMGYDDEAAGRLGMVENIDDNIGRMMAKLEAWGALDTTLVIFMSDNGSNRDLGLQDGSRETPFNAGLRGGKASAHEGGTRVPSFWYWKGRTPAAVDIDALTAHRDVYPTFAELAGVPLPEGRLKPDGRSLVPLFESPQMEWPDRILFRHRGRWGQGRWSPDTREASRYYQAAVRTERWRLVFDLEDGRVVTTLFDIQADRGQTTNLAEQYPEVRARLKAAYDAWWDSTEPFLINEGLPNTPPEEQPFRLLYERQLEQTGTLPEWAPEDV